MSDSTTQSTPAGLLVSEIIGLALLQIGVGVQGTGANAADQQTALSMLNMMLAQWQRRRWLVPNLVDAPCISQGRSTYRVGPGGDFDTTVRPDKIEGAYARLMTNGAIPSSLGDYSEADFASSDFLTAPGYDGLDPQLIQNAEFTSQFAATQFLTETSYTATPNPLDFPLQIISSYEDYIGIGLKGLRTYPSAAFYNPCFPVGELFVWPIPPAGMWEIHILYKQPLGANVAFTDTLNLPPEYADALMWSLAERLAPSYCMAAQPISPAVAAMAKAARNTIRNANAQIPSIGMPNGLSNRQSPFWWPGLQASAL